MSAPTPGTFISRAGWGARAPRSRPRIPRTDGNRLHYNGPAMTSLVGDHTRCAAAVRGIQRFHMDDRGWADIAYTHLVCPHGVIYEGRGVGIRTAAHGTTACNDRYYATMALIGGSQPVYPALRAGLNASIDRLRQSGAGDHVGGHSDCKATACPGDPMRAWIRAGRPSEDAPAPAPKPDPAPTPPDGKDEDMAMLNPIHLEPNEVRFVPVRHHVELISGADFGNWQLRVAMGRGEPEAPDTKWAVKTIDGIHGRHHRLLSPDFGIHMVSLRNTGKRGLDVSVYPLTQQQWDQLRGQGVEVIG